MPKQYLNPPSNMPIKLGMEKWAEDSFDEYIEKAVGGSFDEYIAQLLSAEPEPEPEVKTAGCTADDDRT